MLSFSDTPTMNVPQHIISLHVKATGTLSGAATTIDANGILQIRYNALTFRGTGGYHRGWQSQNLVTIEAFQARN